MDIEVIAFLRQNAAFVEATLFMLGFAESLVLVSFFVPASVLFLAIGGLHEASGGAFLPILIAGSTGAFIGDVVSYGIGRHFKDDLPGRWPFRDNPGWLPRAKTFLERWGLLGVIFAKFIGPLRPIVPTVCGALRMPWLKFTAMSAASSVIWSAAFLAPTYYGLKLLGV